MSESASLHVADYVVFAVMLAISSGIGIYYALSGGKQRTTSEFFMANKSMGILPVTLSLLASFMSAITLLGTPSEMYQFSTQYWMIGPSYIIVCGLSAHLFLPIFYNLQTTSVYEYLELRFSRVVRVQGCVSFLIQMTMYMGIVLYAPALAISAVTGLDWWISVLILGIVCTFYTTIGGMKAVMWTDVFQIVIMFAGMMAIVIVGTVKVGGPAAVWASLEEYGKVEFLNFNPDPTERHTVWCLVLGGACTWLVIYGINQSQVQRYLTTPTIRQAQIAIWLNLPGLWGLLTVCALAGLVVFAYYAKIRACDPLSIKGGVEKGDQILPYFVMDVLNYPGFPGLFIATIFSGALSTVSSGVNALAAVTLEDLVVPLCTCFSHYFETEEKHEKYGARISKCLAIFYGIVALILAFVASQMGGVLQAALGLFGMVGGPILGIFFLGVLFPFANWKGACAGHILGTVLAFWVGLGAFVHPPPKFKTPVNITGCDPSALTSKANLTLSLLTATLAPNATAPYSGLGLYRMSYMWQGTWSIFCTLLIGIIVSAITGFQKKNTLDPRLVAPFIVKLSPNGWGSKSERPAPSKSRAQLRVSGPSFTVDSANYSNPAFDKAQESENSKKDTALTYF